jgi:hypothetical protein
MTAVGVPEIVALCPSSAAVAASVKPAGSAALADHVHGSATEHAMLLAVNVNGPYAAPTPSVIRPCGTTVGLAAITAAGTVNVDDALLAASAVLPAYAAATVAPPDALGVKETVHDAAAPLAASVHDDPKDPVPAVNVNATDPVGGAPVAGVTVAVHDDASPTTAVVHATTVDVTLRTATVAESPLTACVLSPP